MIQFSITNSFLSSIEQIYRIRGVIENSNIVPEWEQKLKNKARLRSGVYSTRIEGNQLTFQEAEKLLTGKSIKARPRDEQELKNYMKVLDYIESKENAVEITKEDIFMIHALTTKKILDPVHHFKWRNEQNAIYNEGGGIVYIPPEWKEVPQLMEELLNFCANEDDTSALIKAAILHHRFVIIHPFIDGNGRSARALTQLYLYQHGFNTKKYFSLEEYYDNDLGNYYDAIFIGNDFHTVFEEGIDSTKFIEYFLRGVAEELTGLQNQIISIKGDEEFEKTLQKAGLNNRQIHIALHIKEHAPISSQELLKGFNVSLATIKRDLSALKKAKIVKSRGVGKATKYLI